MTPASGNEAATSPSVFATYLRRELGLISPEDLALVLDVEVSTLQNWRSMKRGPDYIRLGKTVYYRRADVEEWIAQNVVLTERPARGG